MHSTCPVLVSATGRSPQTSGSQLGAPVSHSPATRAGDLAAGDWLGRDLWAGHWCTTHGIRRDICLLGLENGLDGFPNPFDFFKDVFW